MSQIARAQCTTSLTVIPGLCTTTANTYSTTAIVTLSNPITGVLTITDGTQSKVFATTPTSSATFTTVFTGLISDGNSHTVTAASFGCTPATSVYTAPGSCTQPAGTQLSLTKTVNKSKAKIGDVLTYTLVLASTGNTTATNVVVQDSMSTGLTFVPGSATIPAGTTFTQGTPKSTWKIGTLSANQSFSLTYQAIADSSGVLYNQATIAGDTATVCTSIPVLFCAGDTYVIQLTAAPGRSSYRWFKDDVEITTQTTNILTITAPGTYSLAVDNVSGKCPDFSCCPFIVQEDTLPSFQAIAVPVTCVGNAALTNGQIVLSNFRSGYTYQYSFGTDFNPAASLSGLAKAIPAGGVIVNNLANPVVAQSYTIRVYNASGCYTDVTVVMLPAVCCNVSVVATPGLCAPLTSTYSTTALIGLTNPPSGILTLSDGPKSLTFATTAGSSTTFTATFDNLLSDGTSHTVIISLPGCSTTSTTYIAPASCSIGLGLALSASGICLPATNTYNTTGVISLTNAVAGIATLTDGASTTTIAISAGATAVPYVLSGLPSGTGSHTVTISYLGQTASTTYTAPASCSVATVCSISATAMAGLCSTATNTYSVSVVVNLTNIQPGTLIVDLFGAASSSQAVLSGTNSVTLVFDNLIPDGLNRTITVSLPGCGTTTATFTAPTSCSIAPGCSISAVATAGLCQTATNTYSSTVVVTLANPTVGTLSITHGGQSQTLLTTSATTSLTAVFTNLASDGASHTVGISLPGCSTTSATYTAPASCSIVPPLCSLSALATVGLCATATNTYSASVVVSLTNTTTGTLLVNLPGVPSSSQTVTSSSTSVTIVLDGLISDGVSHTATVSLPGCGTTTATFTAPASCSVAPVCAISAVATAGLCSIATSTYSSTVLISLTNPITGIVTITDRGQSQTFVSSQATTSLTAVFDNLLSDGASHTILVSLPGCSTTSATYTAPASCSIAPVCSISATAMAGLCSTATNTYSVSVVVNLANAQPGTLIVNAFGAASTSQAVSSGTNSVTLVFDNLIPDGLNRTITVNLLGCATTTATFTAPTSCSIAPGCSISAVATAGLCQTATSTYSSTVVISLTNPTTGTLSITHGGQTQTLLTTSATTSLTAIFSNLLSDGDSHTVLVSLPGCSTTSATYTAPTSCSVAPLLAATITPGNCNAATNQYSLAGTISLTAAIASTITLTDATASSVISVSAGQTSASFSLTGLSSGTGTHTLTLSAPGYAPFSLTYTAPPSCLVGVALSVTPGLCQSATNQYSLSGLLSLTNAVAGTATLTDGASTTTIAISAGATSVPYALSGLASGTGSHTVTVSYLGQTTSVTYTAPVSCSVAPICSLSAVATAGICASATNTYSSTVVVTLTNPIAGTLTVTHEGQSQTLLTMSATTSLTATFDNLISDGNSHTVVISLPGCSTTSATYIAPASCRVELGLAVTDPGVCLPGTNTYNTTGVISLTNAVAGVATLTDGASTTTITVSAGATAVPYSLSGLPSGTGIHTVIVSYLGQTASTTYTAPASCSVAPVCSISAVVTAGLCQTATSSYSSTVVISLTNPTTGIVTITNRGQSQTLVSSQATTSLTTVFDNLTSDGNSHTVEVSLPGCSTTSATYTAPASCTSAPAVCSLTATATAGLCATATNTYTSTAVVQLTNPIAGTLTITDGSQSTTFVTTAGVSSTFTVSFTDLVSDGSNHTITASLPGCSTTNTTYTAPASCSIAPVCSISAVSTPSLCESITNSYSSTVLITLTNPINGTLTVTHGGQSLTLLTSPQTLNLTAVFTNLVSDGANHIVTISLPGCSTASTSYVAPASCLPGLGLAVTDPGVCLPGTNTYNTTGVISLTNAVAGVATLTDGANTTTIAISAGATSVPYSLSGLPSGTGIHTVIVSYLGQTASTTYTAPASCSVAPCGLALIVTPGLCESATNTYVLSGSITATNLPTSGTLTLTSDAFATRTIALPAGNASGPISYSGLVANGQTYAITATYANSACPPISQTFSAPVSCSVAPVCSLIATATAGLCASATNTYSASIVVSLTNAPAGTITISLPGTPPLSQTLVANTPTLTVIVPNLPSDGTTHTATISLPGCGTTSASFTAPTSCSLAPVCSISAVATPGLCQSATNTFTNTVVVSLTNLPTGILTVTDGPASLTFASVAASSGSFTATFAGISSTGASHTVTASLPGCSTISTTYTAPVSCSIAPVCSLSATATAGLCATATNTYSATAVIQLINPTAGVLTVTAGAQSATFVTTTAPSATFRVVFPGLLSDGATHTLTASLPGCSSTTTTYTAPASCSVAPVCSISAVVTPGLCQTATNTFTIVALINITNPTTGILTVSDGPASLTFATVAGISASFTATLANIISDGTSHTLTASLPGCSTTSTTYTAPTSCSIAPPVCSLSAVATAGLCATATNTYSSTVVVTLANPTAGTLTVTHGGQSQALLTTSATTTLTAIFSNLLSDGASHTVLISLPGCSTTSATYIAPASCRVEVGLAVTDPGVCLPGTNTYNTTGVISLTNAVAGIATLTDGASTTTIAISAGTTAVPYSLSGLPSGTGTHTVTVSYLGQTTSTTYTAPASCSVATVCSISAVATAGLCASATNTYSSTVVISLTNPTAGTLAITNGGQTQTLLTTSTTTSLTAIFSNLLSDGDSHTILVSLPGCSTTSATYTAPASCSVAPLLAAVITPSNCNSATNQYSLSGTISLTAAIAATLTISDAAASSVISVSAGQTSASFSLTGLSSGTGSHTVTVGALGYAPISLTYTAPSSCLVGVALSVTPGLCQSATNQYSLSGLLSLTNAVAGTATLTDGASTTTIAISAGATAVAYSLSGLASGTGSHTVTVSYVGQTASTTYTAPASCSVAPVCSISAVATAGLCATATNTYSSTVVITLTNPTAGTLTVTQGEQSQTLLTTSATTTLTTTFDNLISDGNSHTVLVSLPGCSTTNATYIAPASCRVGVGLAVTDPGVCLPGTNTYNTTGVISLTNAVAGTATLVDGSNSLTLAVSAGALSIPYSMSGLISGTGTHTVTVSYLGQTASTTYIAPASCTVVCSVTAIATAIPVSCSGTFALQNGKIVVSGFTNGDTYQYSGGVVFNPAVSLSGPAQVVPAGGVIVSNLANPVAAQSYTVRIYSTLGCYKDATVTLLPTVCTCPTTSCVPLVIKQTKGVRRTGIIR